MGANAGSGVPSRNLGTVSPDRDIIVETPVGEYRALISPVTGDWTSEYLASFLSSQEQWLVDLKDRLNAVRTQLEAGDIKASPGALIKSGNWNTIIAQIQKVDDHIGAMGNQLNAVEQKISLLILSLQSFSNLLVSKNVLPADTITKFVSNLSNLDKL